MPCGLCRPGTTTRICDLCFDKYPPKTSTGECMNFGSTSAWGGGFASYISGVKTPSPVHVCYLDGVPCHASEHKMGGITIEIAHKWHDMHRLRLLRQSRTSVDL